jgi:hypothetical protein
MAKITLDLNEAPSPQKGDRLFAAQNDARGEARLHWGYHSLDLYASGFKEAADILVDRIVEGQGSSDSLVFPIGFLYRHYLELRLKQIIKSGRILIREGHGFPTGHKLTDLWKEVRRILEKTWPDGNQDELDAVEECIFEVDRVDVRSDAFRYPVDKDGHSTLAHLPALSLPNLKDVVDRISTVLDGSSYGISVYLDLPLAP